MKKVFQNPKSNWIAASIVVVLWIIFSSMLFTVKEYEKAAAFKFGKYVREYNTPGLKIKAPWPFETIYKVDTRLQLHSAREMTIQEKTKKKLLIDYFILYRIERPKTFFTKIDGNIQKAIHRLDDHTGSDVAAIIGESGFDDIVTNNRQTLLDTIQKMSNRGLEDIDLKIHFMSFNRVELPDENKPAVFRDMINDRNKISSQYRSEGQMISDEITSNADFLVADIVAKANMQADSIRGRADQERIAILNKGYAQSAPLFRIYNEIETYKKSYSRNTEWVLDGKNILTPPK
jgi:membrane protease subunit HflC